MAALTLGKRMPDGVYVHVEALPHLPAQLQEAVETARAFTGLGADAFQVVKLALEGHRLSLLAYPGFFDEAFPVLAASWVVDLGARSVTARAYVAEGNPPILHRKEAMLPPGHPRVPELLALTAEAERLGLFTDTRAIGTRRPWEARLARLGVRVEGHRLVEAARGGAGSAVRGAEVGGEGAAGRGGEPRVREETAPHCRGLLATSMRDGGKLAHRPVACRRPRPGGASAPWIPDRTSTDLRYASQSG